MKRLNILFLVLLTCTPVSAAQIADINFAESLTIEGTNKTVQLNGLAIRYKFIFKIYAAALYTEQPSHSADTLLQGNTVKRMQMHFIYDEVSKEKLVNGWLEGFEKNLSQQQFNALKPRIDQFNSLFETVHEGDNIMLDYLPSQGTRVTIRDKVKGIIKGNDFNQALLKIWIGEEPVNDDMKQGLLGISGDGD
jgi:hypothetical protein